MADIRIANLFASVGMKVDVRQLNMFQKRLAGVKKQLLDLKRLSRTRLSPNTNISAVRSLNTELSRTLRLSRQIAAQGPIRTRRTVAGGAGRGGAGGGRGFRPAGGGFFGGAAASTLGVRGGFVQRNFLGGFTAVVAARQIFQASAQLQGIEVALGAVTREGQTTAEVMMFLRSEAKRLGFDFASSALEYAKLAAAGNSVNLQQETINETFIAAQEAARVFNLSVSDTEGVLKAFTQIISKGKITAEELRNQLGDRLPGAVGIFAKALGVTTQELSEMLEKGEVLADDQTLQAVARQLRSTVADNVEAASRSLTASLNRFRTALFEFSAGLGRAGVGDIFQVGLAGLTNILKILGILFRGLIRVVRILIFPFQAFGRILVRITDSIPKLSATIIGLTALIMLLRTALLRTAIAWVIAFAPVLATAAGIAAAVILIDDMFTALEGGDSVLGRMANSSNFLNVVLGRTLLVIGAVLRLFLDLTLAVVSLSFDDLTASLNRFIKSLREVLGLEAASGGLTKFIETLAGIFGDTPDEIAARATQRDILRPGSPGALASGGGNSTIDIRLEPGLIAEVVTTEQELSLRQTQGDFPDNE